jgi:hypothetical protein
MTKEYKVEVTHPDPEKCGSVNFEQLGSAMAYALHIVPDESSVLVTNPSGGISYSRRGTATMQQSPKVRKPA